MTGGQRPGTRRDHQNFCLFEGWVERRRAKGKRGSHHVNYELILPDGRILYTRISHPVDRSDYGPSLWSHILRDQLKVTAEEFWACVKDRIVPDRGQPAEHPEGIPAGVARALVTEARIPEAEVRAMTRAQAIQRLADYYGS